MIKPSQQRGFTLIELMITVAVVGILAGIAIPAYKEYVQKSRRAEAIAGLQDLRLEQAKYRANNPQYAGDLATLGWTDLATDAYVFSVESSSSTAFLITAKPDSSTSTGADQANDADCLVFAVNQDGPTTDGGGSDIATCWKQ